MDKNLCFVSPAGASGNYIALTLTGQQVPNTFSYHDYGTHGIGNNFKNKGHRRVSPFFIPSVIPNMASGLVSIRMNLTFKELNPIYSEDYDGMTDDEGVGF